MADKKDRDNKPDPTPDPNAATTAAAAAQETIRIDVQKRVVTTRGVIVERGVQELTPLQIEEKGLEPHHYSVVEGHPLDAYGSLTGLSADTLRSLLLRCELRVPGGLQDPAGHAEAVRMLQAHQAEHRSHTGR